MRGSVYYQATQLVKCIFHEGAKKEEKSNPNHPSFQMVSSYKTMESYRRVWENFFNYLKEHWKLKDAQRIEPHHIAAYMNYKVEYHPSKQYMEKISAALGKLEIALTRFSARYSPTLMHYDFSIRQTLLDNFKSNDLLENKYHNRSYINPRAIIEALQNPLHKLAASIELEGGARVEGCALIKLDQLKGFMFDSITNQKRGVLFTKEKGGKEGEIYILPSTYETLDAHIKTHGFFHLNRQAYYKDIHQACLVCKETPEGTHGFRWNFAKNRMFAYAKAGFSHQECLKRVSHEMKHNRASITEHYL